MKIVWIVIVTLLLGAMFVSCKGCGKKERVDVEIHNARNVILISLDALRADRLNCYGFDDYKVSPNIDALAEEGVLFERFITAAPWTTPSHMSMLTGLHPSTHGVTSSFRDVWSDVKRKNSVHGLHTSQTTLAEIMTDARFATAAFTGGGTMDPLLGFDQGFSRYETDTYKMNDDNMSEIETWLEEKRDQRFFLFWHTFETHAPYNNPEFVTEEVGGKKGETILQELLDLSPTPRKNVWPYIPARQRQEQVKILKKHKAYSADVVASLYAGGVKSADLWIGRLLNKLKALSLYEDTVIIITSDHGEELGDHSKKNFYNKHGHTLYEEMVHIPLVIKPAGDTTSDVRIPGVVRMVDLVPTILDLTQIKKRPDTLQGESLVPLMHQPYLETNRTAYIESSSGSGEKKGVTDSEHKYILHIPKQSVDANGRSFIPIEIEETRFYNIDDDPREKKNLLKRNPDKDELDAAAAYDEKLRRHVADQKSLNTPVELDQETIDRLIGLGYLGE